MKYVLTENRVYSAIEVYLKSKGLDTAIPHGYDISGCYYPIEWHETDEEGEYEPAPCIFVYHYNRGEYLDYHGLPPTVEDYSTSDFPLVELDNQIYKQMKDIFGDEIIKKYSPLFFEKVIGEKVKTIVPD